VLDGGVLLHRVLWPRGSQTYKDVCDLYCSYVRRKYDDLTLGRTSCFIPQPWISAIIWRKREKTNELSPKRWFLARLTWNLMAANATSKWWTHNWHSKRINAQLLKVSVPWVNSLFKTFKKKTLWGWHPLPAVRPRIKTFLSQLLVCQREIHKDDQRLDLVRRTNKVQVLWRPNKLTYENQRNYHILTQCK